MQQLIIKYYISRELALAEGRTEYGEDAIRPTEAALKLLTVDERKHLDRLGSEYKFHLPTASTDSGIIWSAIVKLIQESYQEFCAKQEAKVAEHEAKIAECLAKSDDEWFQTHTSYCLSGYHLKSIDIVIPSYEIRWSNDPRITERIDSLKPELEIRQAQIQQENEQAKARYEAEELRKRVEIKELADKKAEAVANLNEWCLATGPAHLNRGAADNYDVVGGCVQWLAQRIQDQFGGVIIRDKTAECNRYSWDERKSPGILAFEKHDAVNAFITALEHPSSVEIEVYRIMHVEVEELECDKRTFTAVVVGVKHLSAASRYVVIEVS